ncbi:AraC family transcriptional regulator [Acinetobacter cumulans]|nr:helix-turn-helix transcriptional regulator [Acinetobacter cumulans]
MPNRTNASRPLGMQLKTNDHIDAALWISFRDDPAQSIYPTHGHAWGEFIYAFDGIMELNIDQIDYITPPPHGIWLPPNVKHSGLNRTAVSHGTLYIHESLCQDLPQQAGILLSSPLISALFEHLRQTPNAVSNAEHQRLLTVLVDQLKHAQLVSSYLPHSEHPTLQALLNDLHQAPANHLSLAMLAKQYNMTERTLARLSQKELGMSLHEWRQRLKVIKAMSLLNRGHTVESIAFDLGYANASAFINMFKRWMHISPDQFRKKFSR